MYSKLLNYKLNKSGIAAFHKRSHFQGGTPWHIFLHSQPQVMELGVNNEKSFAQPLCILCSQI
jgi:hypothetical protein